MARIARVLVPDTPHHIVQRGNRRQDVFFHADDYHHYLQLISHGCREEGIAIWNYCLMANHVHLILTPRPESNLSRAVGEAHRRYTRYINLRENWRGYLWQGRFSSFPMDEPHWLSAAAYVELNPVKANITPTAWDYRWSSVHAYLSGNSDGIVTLEPLRSRVKDWKAFLESRMSDDITTAFEAHERTGRPMGGESFIQRISDMLGRNLLPQKPGPKRKDAKDAQR